MVIHKNCKISLIGPDGVGKTTLLETYILGTFSNRNPPTIGASFVSNEISVNNKIIRLDIWDTAGQERYNSLLPLYVRGSDLVIICLERPEIDTFKSYLEYCQKYSPNSTIFVVFTKGDLYGNRLEFINIEREIRNEGIDVVWHTSAKTLEGVNELFTKIASTVSTDTDVRNIKTENEFIDLENFDNKKPNRCYC